MPDREAPLSAVDVAAAILRAAGPMDHMKLQKLLYLAQAWHLAWYGEPLFEEPLEAWRWGPVVEDVWQLYKRFGGEPIPGPVAGDPSAVRGRAADVVTVIAGTYGRMTGPRLSDLTHEDPVWQAAWSRRRSAKRGRQRIPVDELARYYRAHGRFAGGVQPARVDEEKARRVLEDRDADALLDIFEESLGVRVERA